MIGDTIVYYYCPLGIRRSKSGFESAEAVREKAMQMNVDIL